MGFKSPIGLISPSLEPVRSCHAEVNFTSPKGSMPSADNVSLLDFNGPSSGITATPVIGRNSQIPVPGIKPYAGSASVSFMFLGGGSILTFWKNWWREVYNPLEDRVGLFEEVAGTGNMRLFFPDGSPAGIVIRLIDCWPSNVIIAPTSSQSDGDVASFEVQLEVTDVVYD